MNADISSVTPAEEWLIRRGLIRQVVVQTIALLFFWRAVDALMRTAIKIYEDFDLELPVNTINFVLRPGPIGVAAGTLAMTLLMVATLWLPYSKAAAWLVSLLFLAIVLLLALVALFAIMPLTDIRPVMGFR
jgi:hypothetical protein